MDVPKAECVLQCSDGSGPKYTWTLQTEASVSKNFLSSGGGFAHSSCTGAGAHKSPRLCCSASKQEESSKNLPGQLETSWVTILQKSHLKINRQTIKDRNRLPGRSLKEAQLSGLHARLCAAMALGLWMLPPAFLCLSMQNPGHQYSRVSHCLLCLTGPRPWAGGGHQSTDPMYQQCEPVFSVPSITPLRVMVSTTRHKDMQWPSCIRRGSVRLF